MKKSTRLSVLRGQAKAQGLHACLIPHAPESTGRNLHLTGSGLFCTDSAPVLTHEFKFHLPFPHWNYFIQEFSRRSCQRSPPNPAYTRAPTAAGDGQQLCERTKEKNPNSQPHTGRKEAEPLPWEIRASGTSLSSRSRSGPPCLLREHRCCCWAVLMLPAPKPGGSFQHYSKLSETRLQSTRCFRQAGSWRLKMPECSLNCATDGLGRKPFHKGFSIQNEAAVSSCRSAPVCGCKAPSTAQEPITHKRRALPCRGAPCTTRTCSPAARRAG